MRDAFEQIRQQIHEIRNVVGPVNLKLADMELQILDAKTAFEERALALESKVFGAMFRIDKHDIQIANITALQEKLMEQMKRIEQRYPS